MPPKEFDEILLALTLTTRFAEELLVCGTLTYLRSDNNDLFIEVDKRT